MREFYIVCKHTHTYTHIHNLDMQYFIAFGIKRFDEICSVISSKAEVEFYFNPKIEI